MKLDYKKTFLLGFGFMATTVAWAVYNAYVPILIEGYVAGMANSALIIGTVMTIDNIFGVIFQPLFGSLSDKNHSKMGRRMPYILIGVPICAALLVLVPFTTTLLTMMVVVIAFNFVMSTWRAPVVALMPDLTPSAQRSKANGIINLMGGLGTLIAFIFGGMLFNLGEQQLHTGGMPLPFMLAGIIMVVAVIVLRLKVKEPTLGEIEMEEKAEPKKGSLTEEPMEKVTKNRSLLSMLFAILFWFIGYNAIEAFFSLYVTNTLQNAAGNFLTAGDASIMLSAFSLTYLAFALPAGMIGTKIGRKKTIVIGLIGVIAVFLAMFATTLVPLVWVFLLVAGVFWSMVAINSYPMVVDMGTTYTTGKYTGYYYAFSFTAAIISPILFGWLHDLMGGYQMLFLYSATAFVIALILMVFVKRGEAKPSVPDTPEKEVSTKS